VFSWIGVHNLGPLIVITCLYSFFSGALVFLPNAAVASMTGSQCFGARLGVVFMAMGTTSLIGAPTRGAFLQGEKGSCDNARILSGTATLAVAMFVALGRMMATKWQWKAKA
jgi:hypothetical protein